MTLVDQARAQWTGAVAPLEMCVDHAGQRLFCQVTDLDSLACGFTRLSLSTARLATAAPDELQRVSAKLAARLTYLLEPISPIEIDQEQCVVQMRSNPPLREEDRTSYDELVVRRGGELSLCRWQKHPGEVRQAVAAHVTREVLWRLIGDFSAVVA